MFQFIRYMYKICDVCSARRQSTFSPVIYSLIDLSCCRLSSLQISGLDHEYLKAITGSRAYSSVLNTLVCHQLPSLSTK